MRGINVYRLTWDGALLVGGPDDLVAIFVPRIEVSRIKLFLLNVPFVLAVAAWIWIASLPT